jgi:hypothetical protein
MLRRFMAIILESLDREAAIAHRLAHVTPLNERISRKLTAPVTHLRFRVVHGVYTLMDS